METMAVIAECKKCGREFCTLPTDGIDHYTPRHAYKAGSRDECGGEVSGLSRTLAKASTPPPGLERRGK